MTASDEPLQWGKGLLARAALAATVCLAVGGGVGYALTHEKAPSRNSDHEGESSPQGPPAAGPAELALLAPLHVGDMVDGCAIARIDAVHDGRLALHCTLGDAPIELDVTLASPDSPPAPATSGPYAVYYSAGKATAADAARLAGSLARTLDANASQPRPPGLAPFARH